MIILGGGVSGLGLAWKLAEREAPALVLEANETVGGLARTVSQNGYAMDVGPHSFFSEDQEILRTVLDLFPAGIPSAPRRVKFYYEGKYLDYPLTAGSVLFQMGWLNGVQSAFSFLKSRLFRQHVTPPAGEDETVEDWAISNFGEHLYRTFFKPYTEQFWKIPCAELSSRSIPTHTRMSFSNTLKLLFLKRLMRRGSSLIEREMLPTYYPPSGFGEIADRLAGAARRAGADIRTGCRATAIRRLNGGTVAVEYECNGQVSVVEGRRVVSTLPLNVLVRLFDEKMKTILATLIILAMALSANSQSVETFIHGQPHQTLENKMRTIVLIAAPFLDIQVNILDIFPWLEEETRQADPDGTGIRFDVRIEDPRPLEARNTMDKWKGRKYDYATWPQVRRPTVEQYLIYLTEMADLTYTITTDRVIIEKAK